MCKSLLGFSSLMFLFGVGAFVYNVIPWCYVRSGSYMSSVVVLLQTLYYEWRWLSMFLDVRGWEVVLEVCVLPSVCRPELSKKSQK
jgi:hypothetical protein